MGGEEEEEIGKQEEEEEKEKIGKQEEEEEKEKIGKQEEEEEEEVYIYQNRRNIRKKKRKKSIIIKKTKNKTEQKDRIETKINNNTKKITRTLKTPCTSLSIGLFQWLRLVEDSSCWLSGYW